MTSLERGFHDFTEFVAKLKGDEKNEARGEPITPPGLPPCVKDAKDFITGDCVTV